MNPNKYIISIVLIPIIFACSNKYTTPTVQNFDVESYLGKWYEIARLDSRFEKNLSHTTAEYSMGKDNSIRVLNQGYNVVKKKWVTAKGKAKFEGKTDEAALRVSFFGPFYAPYSVIQLDSSYKYALVSSGADYLWILSREITIPEEIKQKYLTFAKSNGFKTDELIWVSHDSKI